MDMAINIKKLYLYILLACCQGCTAQDSSPENQLEMKEKDSTIYSHESTDQVIADDSTWRKLLTPEQYYVARQKGTERPFTSQWEHNNETGTYYCGACGNSLFLSSTKFESGCGWPSFFQPVGKGSIIYAPDNSHGMTRTEVMCGRCRSHLGHVFDDGPPPTGLRYCINGVILDFEKAKKAEEKFEDNTQ
jgi:peptide-methionine (R)-S-oxide reductase